MASKKGRPPTKGSWKKGQSGNTGGRLKTPDEVRDAYREATHESLATLRLVMALFREYQSDKLAGPAVRAAELVTERAWGKPASAEEDRAALKDALSRPAKDATTDTIMKALAIVEGKANE